MIPGTDWQAMTDGRVWRLKLGRDVHGDMRELQRTAAAIADDAGKAVAILRDDLGKNRYIWVQFADQELAPGQPCACGRLDLDARGGLLRCAGCGRTALRRGSDGPVKPVAPSAEPAQPVAPRAEPVQPVAPSADDQPPAEVEPEKADPAPPRAADIDAVGQAMRAVRKLDLDRRRLAEYSGVHLRRHGGDDEYERLAGWGRHPDGTDVLLLVDYPLRGGERLPDPRHPGEPIYRLVQWPISPFADILDARFPTESDEPGSSATP